MPVNPPCSVINIQTRLAGTAPVSDSWLILLHQGAWGARPVDNLVSHELKTWAQDHGAQVLLARTPQHAAHYPSSTFWFSDGNGNLLHGTLDPNGLPDLQVAQSSEQLLLICTNGKRDQCCATFGRGLITQCQKLLSAELFGHILECTHLGGHRFAPTAIWLPENLVLGRLDPPAVLDLLGKGKIDSRFIRGSTALTPAQQVIQVSLWPLRPDFQSCTPRGNDFEIEAQIEGVTESFLVAAHHATRVETCGSEAKKSTEYRITNRS